MGFALKAGDSQVECRGFRVHCRVAGSGRPPYLLLLHGSFLSMRSWRRVMEPLSESATVIAVDRPAFGETSRPLPSRTGNVSYAPEAQSDMLAELLGNIGVDRAVFVGNSTGGTLAMLTALRHPERVSALVLVDAMIYSAYAASGVPRVVKPLLKAASPLFSGLMRLMISRFFDRLLRSFWHDPARLPAETLSAYRADMMQGAWPRAFWEVFLETHHLHLAERIPSLGVPSLVVTGRHDQTVQVEESLRLGRELPGAELEVVDDCAHLPQEEQPEVFVAAVKRFLLRIG
ncbi:alpha/beta hydrolase [Chlorobium sp. N1]|uniref:alpha/beta fold hydrolase n=1 Tax=Chlorobium sp. N1 TaxID=2491138 RepID=UPI0010401641|nr:alpha/beta hydrolase [Chlorobium sp. N1]TCD48582.1 alpha/beta hydrolase [Chlorobium sp. N1]